MTRYSLRAAALAVLAIALAACGDDRLDPQELRELLVGNTVEGRSGDNRLYHVFFSPSGVSHMRVTDGYTDEGRWRVTADGEYCGQWRSIRNGEESCFIVRRDGDLLLFTQGESELRLTWVQGNPQQLPRLR